VGAWLTEAKIFLALPVFGPRERAVYFCAIACRLPERWLNQPRDVLTQRPVRVRVRLFFMFMRFISLYPIVRHLIGPARFFLMPRLAACGRTRAFGSGP